MNIGQTRNVWPMMKTADINLQVIAWDNFNIGNKIASRNWNLLNGEEIEERTVSGGARNEKQPIKVGKSRGSWTT